jgi:hypothetical protein
MRGEVVKVASYDGARTCTAEAPDALRTLCSAGGVSASPCPYASLARQCVAGRLNLLVSQKCNGISDAAAIPGKADLEQLTDDLYQCCNDKTPPETTDAAAKCAARIAARNAPRDYADEAVNKECRAAVPFILLGKGDASAATCKAYAEEWAAAAAAPEGKGGCASGYCSLGMVDAAAPAPAPAPAPVETVAPASSSTFARGPDYWSAHGDEAANWMKVAPISLW